MVNGNGAVSNRKSFIQQRVEKLYGTTKILTTVKTKESIQVNGNGTHHTNGSATNGSVNGKVYEKENEEDSLHSLPVMKHLRPEFCKQLQFMNSPKKSLRTSQVDVKTDTVFNGNNFKSENGESGNTSLTSVIGKPANKTNDISKDLVNSELVKEDNKNLASEFVIRPESTSLSQEKAKITSSSINNLIQSSSKDIVMESQSNGVVKNGHYFLGIMNAQKTRILKIADETEQEFAVLRANVSSQSIITEIEPKII